MQVEEVLLFIDIGMAVIRALKHVHSRLNPQGCIIHSKYQRFKVTLYSLYQPMKHAHMYMCTMSEA